MPLQESKVGPQAMSRRRQCGFSLLELVIVIVIVSVLLVVAVDKLLALQVDAERVAMEQVAGVVRSGLGIKVAESIVRNDMRAIAALEGSNPMDRLAQLPVNYLGELEASDVGSQKDGNWYFDTRERVLVYLVRNKSFFQGGVGDPPRARFAIRVVYTDRNSNGRYDHGVDSLEGVRLAVLEPYRWTN